MSVSGNIFYFQLAPEHFKLNFLGNFGNSKVLATVLTVS